MKFDNLYTALNKAIEVEEKYQYIDFIGKTTCFSDFVLKSLNDFRKKLGKLDKQRIEPVAACFYQYRFDSVSGRMNSIKMLRDVLDYFKKAQNKALEAAKEKLEAKKAAKAEQEAQNAEERTKRPFATEIDEIDVAFVKGVGPKLASLFNKLSIFTVKDLLEYYPKRYVDYEGRTKIKDLEPGTSVCVFGTLKKVDCYTTKNKLTVIKLTITDGSGVLNIVLFYKAANRRMLEHYKSQYPEGAGIIAYGTVKVDKFSGFLTLDKPQIQVITSDFGEEDENALYDGKITPIYPLCENLNPKTLTRAIFNALEKFSKSIPETLPRFLINELNLISKSDAVNWIHFPKTSKNLEDARFRLVFEELFVLQMNLALIREANKNLDSVALEIKPDGLVDRFIKALPFELTNAQKAAVDEIRRDLTKKEPMQRLLQGDVGSGKTVVACIMLLCAVENGYQGAIMAPTEILATQHYKNFIEWLTPLNLSIGLFLGKNTSKLRREMLTSLKNGQTHIAVGTHALIQNGVEFNNLGAVVVDEQHRFGVKQRSMLAKKGKSPQMLTMTATPIPRTLALTVHGDLDVTTIDELPKGRKPVETSLVGAAGRKEAYSLIREQVLYGHQAYIVYPLIDESETISAKNATQEAERLQNEVFQSFKIGLLHGKMSNSEKEQVMNDFKAAKYDILVSTTVVEVGVDVPNATVMIIENAERFGLSQLHQLRGRVGRSDKQSYCILVAQTASKQTKDKLSVLTQTNNGFIVAQKDLEIRGPGEFLGTRQSGIADFGLADLVSDIKILELAREKAFEFVKNHNIEDFPSLKDEVYKMNMFRG